MHSAKRQWLDGTGVLRRKGCEGGDTCAGGARCGGAICGGGVKHVLVRIRSVGVAVCGWTFTTTAVEEEEEEECRYS